MEVNKSFGKIDRSGIARRKSFVGGRNSKDHVIFNREENNKELNKECVRREKVYMKGEKKFSAMKPHGMKENDQMLVGLKMIPQTIWFVGEILASEVGQHYKDKPRVKPKAF
ncbi:hypothetical protein RhiirA5_386962 [Rhizophagus irregularis]|uniref:Uncharacterized protein n=1 Tax=Rhizophagus irregularis TaxID=588596 RepID=A0A2N0NHB2_9GLOM|nr:hypothetical protein RhiirA5_386962 [Rhizophagus irregularis]